MLVGDHKQLQPTVTIRAAASLGLSVSLFERLVRARRLPVFLLDTQYRMHPAISQFPSDHFYEGRVVSGVAPPDRPPPAGVAWPRPDFPVLFLDVQHGWESATGGTSFANHAEVDAVVHTVVALLHGRGGGGVKCGGGGLAPSEVGIITPYAGQVRAIEKKLQQVLLGGRRDDRGGVGGGGKLLPAVGSVDGFQGKEKTVIVFSAVRANSHGVLGFVSDAKRLNVALTRAKAGIIVVGHEKTLRNDRRSWGPWLDWAHAERVVRVQPRPGNMSGNGNGNGNGNGSGNGQQSGGQRRQRPAFHGHHTWVRPNPPSLGPPEMYRPREADRQQLRRMAVERAGLHMHPSATPHTFTRAARQGPVLNLLLGPAHK